MTRIAFVLALAVLAAACRNDAPGAATGTSKPASGNAWAVVNGNEITRDDVEKAYRRAAPAGQQQAEEDALTAKLNLLNELIVQELLLEKGKALKIELPDAELDKAYLDRVIAGHEDEGNCLRRRLGGASRDCAERGEYRHRMASHRPPWPAVGRVGLRRSDIRSLRYGPRHSPSA
jgi:hypothetical protein